MLDESEQWINNTVHKTAANIVAHTNVVNVIAEISIKLNEKYNSILIKDKEQKQYLLQIVKNYKNKYPK